MPILSIKLKFFKSDVNKVEKTILIDLYSLCTTNCTVFTQISQANASLGDKNKKRLQTSPGLSAIR